MTAAWPQAATILALLVTSGPGARSLLKKVAS
jgi:hypothetical protein